MLNHGYKIAKDTTRHYPYGMMSCIYNLQEQVVYDFEFVSHGDERACALEHLKCLNHDDLVIFDRGYFSYLMFHRAVELKLHAVFRLQRGVTNRQVAEFWKSDQNEALIEYEPSAPVRSQLTKRGHALDFKTLKIRLIKHQIGEETYVYATTLLDACAYPVQCFPDLYHGRWGIEELYGHLLLINLARLFEMDAKGKQSADHPDEGSQKTSDSSTTAMPKAGNPFKTNFKNCLMVVGYYLENLLLASRESISSWLHQVMKNVARRRQRTRPGRSYPRISFKPRSRWNSFGAIARA